MRKIFSLFAALTLSVGLWAANSVITFTSTSKLYPGNLNELMDDAMMGDGAKWAAFKAQFPEFADLRDPFELERMGVVFFNPNAFLDANDQVLGYTYNYDDASHTGTITFTGELITIKDGDFDNSAFIYNESLTSITLPEGLVKIGICTFYGCRNLTTVNIPASLTTIGDDAFDDCYSLTSINFATGSQLTTIGMYAFNACGALATITIPASVTNIGWVAFRVCTSLTDVYVAWTTTLPTLGNDVFEATPVSAATLHVPAGSLALYQNADQWKDFGSIVEYVPQEVKDAAIAAVNAEIEETDNDNVKAIATDAATAINAATTIAEINALKDLAIANIASAKAAYTEGETTGYSTGYAEGETAGDAAGYARAKAELPTEGTTGPAVIITKGDKSITLINPDEVRYTIVEE